MENFKTIEDLRIAIQKLEYEQLSSRILLEEQIITICESLRPINIVKNTVKEFGLDSELKTSLLDEVAAWAIGMVTKKYFVGSKNNFLIKLTGDILEKLVANKIVKNADKLKSFAGKILNKLINKEEHIYTS